MISLGIRAKSNEILFCISEKNYKTIEIKTLEKVIVPQALEVPDRLSYIRTTFKTIIMEYEVENAGIRISENVQSVKSGTIIRMYLEGVLQELLSNCTVERYFAGRKNTIARLLNTDQESVSAYCEGILQFCDFDRWNESYNSQEREAIICAVASLELGDKL